MLPGALVARALRTCIAALDAPSAAAGFTEKPSTIGAGTGRRKCVATKCIRRGRNGRSCGRPRPSTTSI